MKKQRDRYVMPAVVFIMGFGMAWMLLARSNAADPPPKAIKSRVMSASDAAKNKSGWGEMRPYFTGHTSGTDAVFTATGTILPGKSIHGSHRHVEEEYLLITQGAGTWYLDGKEFPAKEGDMLFVEPWVFHGIRNTSDKPLSFFVIKYNPKGVKLPERPDQGPDELNPSGEVGLKK